MYHELAFQLNTSAERSEHWTGHQGYVQQFIFIQNQFTIYSFHSSTLRVNRPNRQENSDVSVRILKITSSYFVKKLIIRKTRKNWNMKAKFYKCIFKSFEFRTIQPKYQYNSEEDWNIIIWNNFSQHIDYYFHFE